MRHSMGVGQRGGGGVRQDATSTLSAFVEMRPWGTCYVTGGANHGTLDVSAEQGAKVSKRGCVCGGPRQKLQKLHDLILHVVGASSRARDGTQGKLPVEVLPIQPQAERMVRDAHFLERGSQVKHERRLVGRPHQRSECSPGVNDDIPGPKSAPTCDVPLWCC